MALTHLLQAWNTQTNTDLSLTGPVGQVYTLVVGNDLLFAGTQVMLIFLGLFMFSPDTACQVLFQVGKCLAHVVRDFDCDIHTCIELCLKVELCLVYAELGYGFCKITDNLCLFTPRNTIPTHPGWWVGVCACYYVWN
jgi:hypothetical protein